MWGNTIYSKPPSKNPIILYKCPLFKTKDVPTDLFERMSWIIVAGAFLFGILTLQVLSAHLAFCMAFKYLLLAIICEIVFDMVFWMGTKLFVRQRAHAADQSGLRYDCRCIERVLEVSSRTSGIGVQGVNISLMMPVSTSSICIVADGKLRQKLMDWILLGRRFTRKERGVVALYLAVNMMLFLRSVMLVCSPWSELIASGHSLICVGGIAAALGEVEKLKEHPNQAGEVVLLGTPAEVQALPVVHL
jgi:hypothetical protein